MDHIELARMGGNAIKQQVKDGTRPKDYFSKIRKKRKSYKRAKRPRAVHK